MHGGDIYSFKKETGKTPLDFSENTNPYGLPNGVKKAIAESLDTYNVYPDPNCRELTQSVSKFYDITEEYLLFGNGAADIIFKIAYAIKPKNALILAPTFSEYEIALKKVGTKIHYFHLREEMQFQITEQILDAISGNDIVYICNPNNPTGIVCTRELMLKILNKCRACGAYLVVDECFMDFVASDMREYVSSEAIKKSKDSILTEVANYQNLIVLKAFTKIFAMAGLRLGFCVSSNLSLLEEINHAGQPWSVSSVAQIAGIACCKESEYIRDSLDRLETERKFLIDSLQNLGFKTYESDANYILFRSNEDLITTLKEAGIMIRSCSNYIGLNQEYYRIAVKRHHENEALIQALQDRKNEEDYER